MVDVLSHKHTVTISYTRNSSSSVGYTLEFQSAEREGRERGREGEHSIYPCETTVKVCVCRAHRS